jgi:hypothetical protein
MDQNAQSVEIIHRSFMLSSFSIDNHCRSTSRDKEKVISSDVDRIFFVSGYNTEPGGDGFKSCGDIAFMEKHPLVLDTHAHFLAQIQCIRIVEANTDIPQDL